MSFHREIIETDSVTLEILKIDGHIFLDMSGKRTGHGTRIRPNKKQVRLLIKALQKVLDKDKE